MTQHVPNKIMIQTGVGCDVLYMICDEVDADERVKIIGIIIMIKSVRRVGNIND